MLKAVFELPRSIVSKDVSKDIGSMIHVHCSSEIIRAGEIRRCID